MSDSLVSKLNEACNTFNQVCDKNCADLGWCDACWLMIKGDNDDNTDERR